MNFEQEKEFQKELKRYSKSWRSLPSDLEMLQMVITTLYHGVGDLPAEHIRKMFFASKKGAVLRSVDDNAEVVKVRLDCRDLNKDMLRVTYIRSGDNIHLIELYAKKDKSREDNQRIKRYLKELEL